MPVPPPPRANRKGVPPATNDTPRALFAAPDSADHRPSAPPRNTPLNFRVASNFARAFKVRAADLESSHVELLEALVDTFLNDPKLEEAVRRRRMAKQGDTAA